MIIIRAAHEADAPAMGHLMVETYLAAHRDHMPAEAWAKRAEEWTPEVSAQGWARTLRELATGTGLHECIYVAVDEGGELIGLAMGGPADADELPQTGAVYALYVRRSHQGRGVGRRACDPLTILRRLGMYNRENRLCQAFRELGRAIRTGFLLQYQGKALPW